MYRFAHLGSIRRCGYTNASESSVQPNWNRFGRELAHHGDEDLAAVFLAGEYLELHPPMKQIERNGALGWTRLNTEPSRIERMLFDLRTVRNNLFHGGKFPDEYVEEPSRDEQLIRSCLAILNALVALPLPDRIAQHFTPEG